MSEFEWIDIDKELTDKERIDIAKFFEEEEREDALQEWMWDNGVDRMGNSLDFPIDWQDPDFE